MKNRGFTLAELSIVLVIVGLLFVGIIKGQSLIGQVKAKDVIAIVEDLRNATTLFKQRFKYLPGDWPYGANEIPNVIAGTTVGNNGDGYIDGSVDANGKAANGSEVAALPWQLFNAGFIGKIDQSDLLSLIKTSYGTVQVVSRATADGLVPGFSGANPMTRNAIVFFMLPCDLAFEVDSKIDDSSVLSGKAFGTACVNNIIQWYAVVL